ncbi:MAG: DUF1257 domain-containing protein [Candidatus Omnitrophica bacterium]|nr:DUF1257 domain-containing protein [Candidatus Omnitrophota bacterium]
MSALCGIELTMESLALIKKTLDELRLQHRMLEEIDKDREKLFAMEDSEGRIEKVSMLITDAYGLKMGLQKQKNGKYRVITSASSRPQLLKQKKIANRIKQRYAYNRIREELQSKGYSIVEEKKTGDNTIRLVARHWR